MTATVPVPSEPRRVPGRPPVMIYLHPGQVSALAEPAHITTVLGSCVAVCLFDEVRGVGGMNHFVLPDASDASGSARYARPAFEALLHQVLAVGARRARLQAKLFGGAVTVLSHGENPVGERNVEVARALLAEHAIRVVAEDVGGAEGRKLLFETCGGGAWVRRLGGGTR